MIAKGTPVAWTLKDGTPGNGVAIADEADGHVLVAVLSEGEEHHVIYCATTWLTVSSVPDNVIIVPVTRTEGAPQ